MPCAAGWSLWSASASYQAKTRFGPSGRSSDPLETFHAKHGFAQPSFMFAFQLVLRCAERWTGNPAEPSYLGANADRLHEALQPFEARRSGETGSATARNETATKVENGDPESRGHVTDEKSDTQDRSENPQSAAN